MILKNTGLMVTLKQKRRCDYCNGENPEMAIEENGMIYTYHWECVSKKFPECENAVEFIGQFAETEAK